MILTHLNMKRMPIRLLVLALIGLMVRPVLAVDTADKTRTVILAHYMPWYTAKPFDDHWGWHWTMNHFDPDQNVSGRPQIASRYTPLIGPYDSGDPAVLECQLLQMKISGIDGVIVDWYGRTNYRDYAILHRNTTRLLQQTERLKMRFVICYEDQTIPALVKANRISPNERVSHAVSEIDWLGQYWFRSASYLKLDGKPLLLSFGHAGLTDEQWKACLSRSQPSIAYFSQDYRREGAQGGFGWPVPKLGLPHLERFLTTAKSWPAAIPVAFPRFNDIYREAGVSDGYPQIADDRGRTFVKTLRKAIDAQQAVVQIATWNDWGEGTQIEPSNEFGYRDLEAVQAMRQRQDSNFQYTTEDLRLPHRLLELRREGIADVKELDQAILSASRGDLGQARRLIALRMNRRRREDSSAVK